MFFGVRLYCSNRRGQNQSGILPVTRECKHCGASLGRHAPFSSMKKKSCPFEEMSPISGYLPRNARWRSEVKARREDEMAVSPGFDSSHWLFSLCFRAPSPNSNTAERSQSINGHQSRKRNFGRQSSFSCVWKTGKEGQMLVALVSERRVKKDRTLVEKSRSYCPNWSSWTPDTVGEETKNRAYDQASFREEIIINQSQTKAKSTYGICAGFWFDRCGHKAKRSDARFIYIYIANGENPSQHVSVGLAEARPNKSMVCTFYHFPVPSPWIENSLLSGSFLIKFSSLFFRQS